MTAVRSGHGIGFLSTPSARRATLFFCFSMSCTAFLSTPSARRATQFVHSEFGEHAQISIHALREEGDGIFVVVAASRPQFLSTPSARRATRRRIPPG